MAAQLSLGGVVGGNMVAFLVFDFPRKRNDVSVFRDGNLFPPWFMSRSFQLSNETCTAAAGISPGFQCQILRSTSFLDFQDSQVPNAEKKTGN